MEWSRIEIDGKEADVLTPAGPRHVLIYLHPVGQESLAESGVFSEILRKLGIACVAPAGGFTWWSDRILPEYDPQRSAERYLIDAIVPWVRSRWAGISAHLGLFGISMGGQGAIRLGFKHPELFPVVAGIASAFDYYEWYGGGNSLEVMYPTREACRQDGAILHINPHHTPAHLWFACDPDDVWHRGNDRLHEKLNAIGIAHTADLSTRAGGHSWDYFHAMARPALEFCVAGLKQMSRRLL